MTISSIDPAFTKLLREKGIDHVLVIDDAYDNPWPIDRITLEDFWAQLEADEDIFSLFLTHAGSDIKTLDEIDQDVVLRLWENRENLGDSLKDLCKTTLFSTALEKQAQLDIFSNHLQELDITITPLGNSAIIPDGIRPPIIFIDYYMGVDNDTKAVEKAKSIAGGIYEKYDGNHKPLIILMSSVSSVSKYKEEFRDESGLIGGMFYFVSKDDLTSKEKLFLQLGAWARNLPTGYKIQSFIDALSSSLPLVLRNFMKDLKSLSIEDYAYIYNLSLLEDGHPLGDYMRWLYGSYLLNLLFSQEKNVSRQLAEMDKIQFTSPPLSHSMPSLDLAKIYRSALFDNADSVSGHPSTLSSQDEISAPYLHLGDLFINNASNLVWMVANAECDLAISADGSRSIPAEQSIILIPGRLQQLSDPVVDTKKVRTELFEHGGISYRIVWEIKNVVTVPYSNIKTWMNENKCERVARIKQVYALEVQRAFSADLTRIGMPVAPPFYRPVKVQILFRNLQDRLEALTPPLENIAFVVVTRDHKEKCVFTVEFGFILKEKIHRKIQEIEAESQNNKNQSNLKYLQSLQQIYQNFNTWFLDLKIVKLQTPDKDTKLSAIKSSDGEIIMGEDKLPIRIRRNLQTDIKFQNSASIIINILER